MITISSNEVHAWWRVGVYFGAGLGFCSVHYGYVIMGAMEPQITSLPIVYLTGYSGEYERKHQSSASLAFVRGIHRGPVNSPPKWPVTRKMFPFDDVIMPRGLLFISGWSWFSLTMGMLRVVFEIIVGAAQTCPCCVNIAVSRMAYWLFILFIVAQQVEFQSITKYILFWCRHRYLRGSWLGLRGFLL